MNAGQTYQPLEKAGYLQYQYLRHTLLEEVRRTFADSQESALPRIHLFVGDSDRRQLESHRPASGFRYVCLQD